MVIETAMADMNLSAFCDNPHRTPAAALIDIDARCHLAADPVVAGAILRTEWTAVTILLAGSGIPAAHWLEPIAAYRKFKVADLSRVKDAVEMRLRAVDRVAA